METNDHIHWTAELAVAKLNAVLAEIEPYDLQVTRDDILVCMGSLTLLQRNCELGRLVPKPEALALWDDRQ